MQMKICLRARVPPNFQPPSATTVQYSSINSMRHMWTDPYTAQAQTYYIRSTHRAYTRIHHDHTPIIVVHTRIVLSRHYCKTAESLNWSLLPLCWALQHWSRTADIFWWFPFVSVSSSSAESNTVIACQISRLWTPRARTMVFAGDPILHRGVKVDPLRASQPRAGEKTHGCRRNACPKQITWIPI